MNVMRAYSILPFFTAASIVALTYQQLFFMNENFSQRQYKVVSSININALPKARFHTI